MESGYKLEDLRIGIAANGGEKTYAVVIPPDASGLLEAIQLKGDDDGKEYTLASDADGHYCSCENFEFKGDRANMACKHLHCCFILGIMRMDLVPYLTHIMERIRSL